MHVPTAPLADYVAMLWFLESPPGRRRKECLLPTGTTELVFNLRDNETRVFSGTPLHCCRRLPGSIIAGPHSKYFVIDTDEQESVLGVHFKPGGARPFFALPADDLHNLHVAVADVWGVDADALRDELIAARGAEAKFRVLECALLARLEQNVTHPAVAFAVRELSTSAMSHISLY